jgi:predicted enzyme related to lactoylglutathione lyase
MIKQFAGASVWSEDLNNLLPFYRDVLGISVTLESPGFVLIGGNSADAPALGLGTHSEIHGRNTDPSRHLVSFMSDDVMADWKRLKDAGVEFIEDPNENDELIIATLKDPEGNLVQLLQWKSN